MRRPMVPGDESPVWTTTASIAANSAKRRNAPSSAKRSAESRGSIGLLSSDAATLVVVAQEVERWQRGQSRRFTPLSESMRVGLMKRSSAVRAGRLNRTWEDLESVLGSS